METKKDIRSQYIKKRDALSQEEVNVKSDKILYQLFNMTEYKDAKYILLYADYHNEVATNKIFEDARQRGKKIYFPKVFGQEMEFYSVDSLEELRFGYKGIREPQENPIKRFFYKKQDTTIMIVPGVAFDMKGYRVGYGKGYYDKYLARVPKEVNLTTIALSYEKMIKVVIPTEGTDWKTKYIVTEDRIVSTLFFAK